jgi:A/G-specific adenine glycosylase
MKPPTIDPRSMPGLHAALLNWFAASARDLPWRRRRSLYGTWLSEMMLQQTTVAAVVPYWERFMERFPDVRALAAADEAEVLAMWSGLGYYRRARMLHAAARAMAAAGGRLPADHAGWLALPGVGDYAAGAVASIGLGQRVPAVDANARRVITRWAAADPEAAARLGKADVRRLAENLVPAANPGAWNEGLMELGATVCRARDPRCGGCPVADWCAAGRSGRAAEVPPPVRRAAPTAVSAAVLVVRRGGEILLEPPGGGRLVPVTGAPVVRGDLAGLHKGMWSLPTTPWHGAAEDRPAWLLGAQEAWQAWGGSLLAGPPEPVGHFSHGITRFRLALDVLAAPAVPGADAEALAGPGARWTPWPTDLPVSRLVRKALAVESRPQG